VIERFVNKRPRHGGIISQGDGAHTYQLAVTVEDRAKVLAEVGSALRPVVEQMQHRIAQLEHENRVLRDGLDIVTRAVPAMQPNAIGPATALDVGSDPERSGDAHPFIAAALQAAPRVQQSLLEELRRG